MSDALGCISHKRAPARPGSSHRHPSGKLPEVGIETKHLRPPTTTAPRFYVNSLLTPTDNQDNGRVYTRGHRVPTLLPQASSHMRVLQPDPVLPIRHSPPHPRIAAPTPSHHDLESRPPNTHHPQIPRLARKSPVSSAPKRPLTSQNSNRRSRAPPDPSSSRAADHLLSQTEDGIPRRRALFVMMSRHSGVRYGEGYA